MTRRTKLRVFILAWVVVFIMASFMTSAEAHNYKFRHGADVGWISHGYQTRAHIWEHRKVGIRDNECDGHTAYMEYELEGSDKRWALYDANGCRRGATSWNYSHHAGQYGITWARICERGTGCKPWHKIYPVLQGV